MVDLKSFKYLQDTCKHCGTTKHLAIPPPHCKQIKVLIFQGNFLRPYTKWHECKVLPTTNVVLFCIYLKINTCEFGLILLAHIRIAPALFSQHVETSRKQKKKNQKWLLSRFPSTKLNLSSPSLIDTTQCTCTP